jgi:tRNA nucleotidyltransferase/poly(A) polymerase
MPQIFRVGGCIRDGIIGINSKDIDFTFVLDNLDQTVEEGFIQMEQWMKDGGFEIFLSTPDMFTIRGKFPKDHVHAGLVADFVMARKEIGYIEGTRRPILALGNLEDDLVRRDFTVNSLCIDEKDNLIDLFNGREDLRNMILRTPQEPLKTLLDDPLRVLRCWRFSITKGFSIHPDLYSAMLNDEVLLKLKHVVSVERIREELFKMFNHDTNKTLELLFELKNKRCDLLDIILQDKIWLKPTVKA